MIEISEKRPEDSRSILELHRTLELKLGRIIRVREVDQYSEEDSFSEISSISGRLLTVQLKEVYEGGKLIEDDSEMSFFIQGQDDEQELDLEYIFCQIHVLQEDSGVWSLIYQSKGWAKQMKRLGLK